MRYWSLSFLLLAGFNLFIWYEIIAGTSTDLNLYFLNVGQGDSELVELPGGTQVLIDGGPDKSVLFELSKIMPGNDRYIDLVVMTHPQTDHFAGLIDVVERYKIGAFVTAGREGESEAWGSFEEALVSKRIPVVLVQEGDVISYKDNRVEVLAPSKELLASRELNDSSIVLELHSEGIRALFTGDAGFPTENKLTSSEGINLDVDVLKVGHHGSRFATGASFLAAATPLISVIEVGKNNYGHPTEAALNRLEQFGSGIYRTDKNGAVHLRARDGKIAIYPESN